MQSQMQEPRKKFSFETHKFDANGNLVSVDHYRLHNAGGTSYYERPKFSGNLWFENNEPAGRVEYKANEKGKLTKHLLIGEEYPHQEYVKPLSGAEAIAAELAQAKAELAQIKAEQSAKAQTEVKVTQTAPAKKQPPTLPKG